MINAGRDEVFVDNLLTREGKEADVGDTAWIRLGIKDEVLRDSRVHSAGDGAASQHPVARVNRWHMKGVGNPFRLPDAFVVGKKEGTVLDDRAANRAPKLVPRERR